VGIRIKWKPGVLSGTWDPWFFWNIRIRVEVDLVVEVEHLGLVEMQVSGSSGSSGGLECLGQWFIQGHRIKQC
jgi:hypothetical protein